MSQQKSRRLKKKAKSLKDITKELSDKNLITSTCQEMLESNFFGVPFALLKRMNLKSGKGSKYSPELKSFALTLQFYSSKAYEFVSKTFNLALPHQVQVRKWYAKVPAEPGFTNPAFQALKLKKQIRKVKKLFALLCLTKWQFGNMSPGMVKGSEDMLTLVMEQTIDGSCCQSFVESLLWIFFY